MQRLSLLSAALLLSACAATPRALDVTRLERDVAAAEARSGGRLGVAVVEPSSGQRWVHHAGERFPLQSTFKAPLAAAVLARVDAGALALDTKIEVRRDDLSVCWSPLAEAFQGEAQSFSLLDLLTQSVAISDNTAADVLMHQIGGPDSVNALLSRSGVTGMRVDRYERDLQLQFHGFAAYEPAMSTCKGMDAAIERLPKDEQLRAFDAYLRDPRDTTTPEAAADFLLKLDRGEMLTPASTRVLLDIMHGAKTGIRRLRAGLPPDARLAHKTGTSADTEGRNGATNDIGIVSLPDGRKLVIVALLTDSSAPEETREGALADVARAAVGAMTIPQ
ncbi:class A beta-lactamase [Polyangium sp. y55x31]|uniref:class A beta-lactamase n=1 Tax=Polyangium sp. y55x31 TaxID=3042688 RepID=UPI0024831CDB|nr:class A beta-lactamase [Polyangium sp. y55x31]MDI1479577.1 class A beta-lactamase [Polyangium sp. y55x31]